MITISKISDALQVEYQTATSILERCVEIGLLEKLYALKCHQCEMLLIECESLSELLSDTPYCSVCERVIDTDEIDYDNDVILLFSINVSLSPFQMGQQDSLLVLNASGGTVVHHIDTLGNGVHYQLVTYHDLYRPTSEKHKELNDLLEQVDRPHENTTEHGASLEALINNLFSQCALFRTTIKHKSQTNQIDILVRIQGLLNCALFNQLGSRFYIECKNEKATPSIDYLQKFRGLLHESGMCFGIFINKMKEPTTYRKNVNHIFLKDNIVIIRICMSELKSLISGRQNLLECLDKKITEVTTNAKYSLGQNGLALFDT